MLNKAIRLLALLALISLCLGCGSGSSIYYREGHKAELHKDWDTAVVDYEKAKDADPANSLYILHERNARFNASMFHLRTGRQMLKDGRADDAAGELQKAVRIDPSNQAAQQELN